MARCGVKGVSVLLCSRVVVVHGGQGGRCSVCWLALCEPCCRCCRGGVNRDVLALPLLFRYSGRGGAHVVRCGTCMLRPECALSFAPLCKCHNCEREVTIDWHSRWRCCTVRHNSPIANVDTSNASAPPPFLLLQSVRLQRVAFIAVACSCCSAHDGCSVSCDVSAERWFYCWCWRRRWCWCWCCWR